MKELWRRWQWFTHRHQFDSDLEEEMRHHLALKAVEQGSATAARHQFGNVTLWKENSRTMWTGTFWEQFARDIRYGLRGMLANKLFTVMAVLSLALGIGANTAIYSFMDAIMIRALPVQQPEQLAIVNLQMSQRAEVVHSQSGTSSREPGGEITTPNLPFTAYEFLRDHNHVFEPLFGYARAGRLNLLVEGQAELAEGEYVSGGYFSGLGVGPAAGRLIGFDDDNQTAVPVVTLAYSFWQRRFGGRADVLGKTILLNDKPFVISGVAPPDFFGVRPGFAPQVFIPVRHLGLVDFNPRHNASGRFTDDHFYWMEMMGRLKPGVTLPQAQASLATQFHNWVTATAKTEKERAALPILRLQEGGSGIDSLRRQFSKPLYVLMSMVGLTLLIACANIANLLLVRAAARSREMAVRLSLGASRFRVMRQLLTESILLSLVASALGLLIALGGMRALTLLLANGRQNLIVNTHLDGRVLLFTSLVAIVTGLLFGLAPAIQATKVDIAPALKEMRTQGSRGRKRRIGLPFGLSQALVVWQIATSLLLVAAAGLFVKTVANLHSVSVGFNQERLLLFSVSASQAGYQASAATNLYAELQQRFIAIPGVRDATMTHMPLLANGSTTTRVTIPGSTETKTHAVPTAILQIGPRFFETMQIPILLGRALDARDREDASPVAVVNEVFAKKYLPGVFPIGRQFDFHGRTNLTSINITVVGVARTARYNSLSEEIPPVVYLSYRQQEKTEFPIAQMFFELRAAGDPLALANTVRHIVHEVSPRTPVADLTTQSQLMDQTISQQRTFANLCGCFSVLALIMASVGLYGMTAYAVTRRTNEIGIRMALGAERSRIVWMVLREVLILGTVGLVVGSVAVWQTTTALKSFLFGLQPHDPWILGSAAATLIACAILAGFIPARRASRIDPMAALRHE